MEPKLYYWMKYRMVSGDKDYVNTIAIDDHPFLYIKSMNNAGYFNCTIEDWKQITETEYNLWKELNK